MTDPKVGYERCCEAAVRAGVKMVQLRMKYVPREELLHMAKRLVAITNGSDTNLIVDDDASVAAEAGADGVHVGQDDMKAGNARELIGNEKILGVSVRTAEEALEAERQGADYLGAGAVFHTGSKDDAVDITHEALREICRAVKIPVVAIGGINAGNIHILEGSGIEGVAVISAIFASGNITEAARELRGLSEKYFAHD